MRGDHASAGEQIPVVGREEHLPTVTVTSCAKRSNCVRVRTKVVVQSA